MPVTLTHIVQVLHKFGASLDREAVTRVNIDFLHTPSDLEGVFSESDWTLGVRLSGVGTGMAELFSHSWTYQGSTEEEVLQGLYEEVVVSMKSFHSKQVSQTRELAGIIDSLESRPEAPLSVNGTHSPSPAPGE